MRKVITTLIRKNRKKLFKQEQTRFAAAATEGCRNIFDLELKFYVNVIG